MKKKRIAAVFLLFLFTSGIFAQRDKIRFDRISTHQGLSQNSVTSIYQDTKGFLWFGTNDGLNRYDGVQFRVFRHITGDPNSLCQNLVRGIQEDKFGDIWIGTEDGLSRFNPATEKFTNYYHDVRDSFSIAGNRIRNIYRDKLGTIWILTENGVNKFNWKQNRFNKFNHTPGNSNNPGSNFVRTMFEDSKGNLWFGTENGLYQYNPKTSYYQSFVHDSRNINSLSENIITVIYEDSKGILWIGTRTQGLNKFDYAGKKFTRLHFNPHDSYSIRNNTIRDVLEDELGNLWIATYGGGLCKYVRKTNRFVHHQYNYYDKNSLSSNTVNCLQKDFSGIIWIGTDFGGLSKLDRRKNQFTHYSNNPDDPFSLNINSVTALYEDPSDKGNTLWVGTWGGGLGKFDRRSERFTFYRHSSTNPNSLSNDVIRSITKDRFGILWIGTDIGVTQFNPGNNEYVRHTFNPDDPNSISQNLQKFVHEDRDGEIWIGTNGGGLEKYDRKNNKFIHFRNDASDPFSLSDNITWCVYEDKDGYLWLGTDGGGLNKFDKKTGKFYRYLRDNRKPNSLNNNKILSICGDDNGIIWLGTAGGGLNKFDSRTGNVTVYNEMNGLASNTIHAIVIDNNGNLWLSSTQGIAKFDTRTETFINFNKENGLQSSEFHVNSVCKSVTGELIFGGINGFNIFRPEVVEQNKYIPQVAKTDFQLFNKSVAIGKTIDGREILSRSITLTDKINLDYSDKAFTIQFAALDFTAPEKNLYAYKLEGVDNDWNLVANRNSATYTKLPAGSYKFIVKGSNHNGVWSNKEASLEIIISPPFWESWWFRSISFVILIGLMVGGYKIRTARITLRSKELELKVSERTKQLELVNRELESFSHSISYDLREPLHAIDKYSKQFLAEYDEKIESEGQRLVNVIINNVRKMGNLICDLLDFSKIGRSELKTDWVDMNSIINTCLTEQLDESKKEKYLIAINSVPYVLADSALLKQVWINLISNAIKFTSKKENPEIIIGSASYGSEIEFYIKDNGAGFDQNYAHKLFGVFQRLHKEEEFEGTGVGLAIVQRIIQRHNGRVWAEGSVNNGATFHFTLPVTVGN